MKFEHTVGTAAPPERIWKLWTDVERWPVWDTELASASLEKDFEPGARGTLKPRRGPASTLVVSDLKPGESYVFTTRLPLCELKVGRRLVCRDDGGTFFTHEVSFVGPLSFLFGSLLGRRYREFLPRVMDNLRRIAEEPGTP